MPRRAAVGQVEGESNRALDPRSRIDRRLDRDFLGCSLPGKSPRAHVKIFVVFPDDDHIDVVGPFALDRAIDTWVKLNRSEVDVLLEIEAQAQEDSFFQNARRDVGMADCTEQDGITAMEPFDFGGGQNLPRLQVALPPEVEVRRLERDVLDLGNRGEYLEALHHDFGPNAIARQNSKFEQILPPRFENIPSAKFATQGPGGHRCVPIS